MSLTIDDVSVRYGTGTDATTAVDAVDLDVPTGQVLALLGPSGCGKSSLLRAVAGLEPLAAGRVYWDGVDLAGVPVHRRGFGLMFQDGQLFAHRDVAGNIGFGLQMAGDSRAERAARVDELLDLVGLPGFQDRAVASLSGGQAQRVSLARSLAPRPRLLLLDEPLAALDRALREHLATELHRILRRAGTTALYVTHDHDEAFTVADRVAVMMAGRIVQVGAPDELWSAPANPEVAEFLGYSILTGDDAGHLALSPQALQLSPDPHTGGNGDDDATAEHLTGTVVRTGVSRGRTIAVVDLPHWGRRQAVAAGVVDLRPGQRVHLRLDPAGVVRW